MLRSKKVTKALFGSKTDFGSFDGSRKPFDLRRPVYCGHDRRQVITIDGSTGVFWYLIDRIEALEAKLAAKPKRVRVRKEK